mgnify:CR=1 FL=1
MKLFATTLALTTCLLANPAFAQDINFGDDNGDYTNDGECDDPRFIGPNMADMDTLLADDILHDATDCADVFATGSISVSPAWLTTSFAFGDDDGDYAKDGQCDDPRFVGAGMASMDSLLIDDVLHDASDCKAAFDAGELSLAVGWVGELESN